MKLEEYQSNCGEWITLHQIGTAQYVVEQIGGDGSLLDRQTFKTEGLARQAFAYRVLQWLSCFSGVRNTELDFATMLKSMEHFHEGTQLKEQLPKTVVRPLSYAQKQARIQQHQFADSIGGCAANYRF